MPKTTQRTRLLLRWSVAMALVLPGIALAGGKATLVSSPDSMPMGEDASGTMTITWENADTARLDFGDPSHYLIARDGKTYTVSTEGGQTMVMDMASMGAMMQAMSAQGDKNKPFGQIHVVEDKKTTATVADIKGQVYHLKWSEPDGNQKSGDAVLTDDPLVVEMTQAYFNAISTMVGSKQMDDFLEALPQKKRGILQMGEQFHVESIQKMDPPASTFELPAKPMNMQDLLKGKMPG